MNIDSIKNGIVIDHITAGNAMEIYRLLKLDTIQDCVAIIMNVSSNKMGKKDIIKIDALIDIVYVALGTALALGVSPEMWNKGWAAVHKANMAKERALRAEDSKRGTTYDVVKPEGWQSPEKELANVLKQTDNL